MSDTFFHITLFPPFRAVRSNIQKNRKAASFRWNILVNVVALVLLVSNFPRIFDNAFWGDEGYTIMLSKMGFWDMIQRTAGDVHPPLHYLLTQVLYHLFGNHGFTYHLTAFIPYALLLLVGCTIVKKSFGIIPSLILIIMCSLMQQPVYYNLEVRMYSLAALFVLLSFYELYNILKEGRWSHWLFFTLASLGAAYTHYYALVSVAFFYLVLWARVLVTRKQFSRLLACSAFTVLSYLPWLGILLTTFNRTVDNWWATNIPTFKESILFIYVFPWLLIVAVVCLVLFFLYESRLVEWCCTEQETNPLGITLQIGQSFRFSNELIWVLSGVLATLGTLAVGLILSHAVRPLFLSRYLYAVVPVSYLTLGVTVSKLKFKQVWAFLLVLALLWNTLPAFLNTCKSEEKLDSSLSCFLESVQPSTDEVLLSCNSHLPWTLFSYYYPENQSFYISDMQPIGDQPCDKGLVFWSSPLNDDEFLILKEYGFSVSELYEGRFSDGSYYYVYQVNRGVSS